MAATNNNTYEQVYNAKEDEDLSSRVAMVICILVRRGILAAGFSITKELLMMHYTGYSKNKPVWELDFFEHLLTQEPLFGVREKVKGVFIGTEKNLIVPDELYEEKDARKWLKQIHYAEAKDVIEAVPLEEDKAHFLHAIPVAISELVKINFKKAAFLPLCCYHFANSRKQSLYMQCCITGEQVFVTLHNYSQLLWHQVFDYSTAEDIAYMLKHFCMENNISPSKIAFRCDTISGAEYDIITQLTQYFPGIRSSRGTINSRWDGAKAMAQQLFECV